MTAISFTIDIKAEKQFVWKCLVERTSEWWDQRQWTSPYTKKMELEGWIGGHLYEDFGEKEGLVWAEVIAIKTPHFIQLKGHLSPEYGGPSISFSKIELQDKDDSTQFSYSESWMGKEGEKFLQQMQEGWLAIFNQLKEFAENDLSVD